MNPDPDAWLDAFDPRELDDPALPAVDAAVARVASASPPARRSRTPLVVAAVFALAAAAVVAFVVRGQLAPPTAIHPGTPASIAVVSTGADHEPQRRTESVEPAESVESVEAIGATPTVTPAPSVVQVAVVPPPPVESPPPVRPKRPGLEIRPGSRASLDGHQVQLALGVLVYRHDVDHEPGVDSVRFTTPAVVVRPVGTAFAAAAENGRAAVRVTEGEVWIQHPDGRPVTTLRPGDEVLLGTEGGKLTWSSTTGMSLGRVPQALDVGNGAAKTEVISLLASVRLAAREGLTDHTLPFALPTEP